MSIYPPICVACIGQSICRVFAIRLGKGFICETAVLMVELLWSEALALTKAMVGRDPELTVLTTERQRTSLAIVTEELGVLLVTSVSVPFVWGEISILFSNCFVWQSSLACTSTDWLHLALVANCVTGLRRPLLGGGTGGGGDLARFFISRLTFCDCISFLTLALSWTLWSCLSRSSARYKQ